jgi:hypothetical protein
MLINELVLVNEFVTKHDECQMNVKECEVNNHFTQSKMNHFEKPHNLYGYFVLLPPNYLVGKYAKYIWHVEKIIVLSHDLTMFRCIFIIPHSFKY